MTRKYLFWQLDWHQNKLWHDLGHYIYEDTHGTLRLSYHKRPAPRQNTPLHPRYSMPEPHRPARRKAESSEDSCKYTTSQTFTACLRTDSRTDHPQVVKLKADGNTKCPQKVVKLDSSANLLSMRSFESWSSGIWLISPLSLPEVHAILPSRRKWRQWNINYVQNQLNVL